MASASTLAGKPRYLAFLPDFLFRADGGKVAYILRAFPLVLLPGQEQPFANTPEIHRGVLLIALVLIGPFIETIILAGLATVLDRWFGAGPAAVASSVLWGAAHSAQVPMWGLVVWWPFLVMTVAFLAWRGRGFWTAVLVVTAMHGLQNSLPALSIVLS